MLLLGRTRAQAQRVAWASVTPRCYLVFGAELIKSVLVGPSVPLPPVLIFLEVLHLARDRGDDDLCGVEHLGFWRRLIILDRHGEVIVFVIIPGLALLFS